MLIQRTPWPSTVSTLGSRLAAGSSTRARERLSLGFGRLGIGTERVVGDGHRQLILLPLPEPSCILRRSYIAVASRGVEGHGPAKPRQPSRERGAPRNGANSIEM